jgi:hypothetical protein
MGMCNYIVIICISHELILFWRKKAHFEIGQRKLLKLDVEKEHIGAHIMISGILSSNLLRPTHLNGICKMRFERKLNSKVHWKTGYLSADVFSQSLKLLTSINGL